MVGWMTVTSPPPVGAGAGGPFGTGGGGTYVGTPA
ncbi:Uncharacterised protein [Mycobacteroides abscessus subsp. abscessus]|nr:Uncharacterised protein [Mycobacteroides abscessus subsp. abscessus]SKV65684.1 Uncharacterised protein [Mycobacteroides abscessus subsp. abscessus]